MIAETDQPQLIDLPNLFEMHQLKAMLKVPACFSIKIKEVRMTTLLVQLNDLTNFDVRGYSGRTTSTSGYPHPIDLRLFYACNMATPFHGESREPNTIPSGNKLRRLVAVVGTRHPTKVVPLLNQLGGCHGHI
ncbi:hypothetical protein [Leminorella grimontii]|uniref:hypothetical protein n=1 Tax=Leminorella grimontii TaxID=82981 RepID=UPI0021C371DE|nr:hypothetical protein [Leminorella grimontii]